MGESYKIRYIGDADTRDVHYIGVDYRGILYRVIFGRYVNGGFCSIPNRGVGCDLARFDDVLWNEESLREVLNRGEARAIANAIADHARYLELKESEVQDD